jgi:hypothetical protein
MKRNYLGYSYFVPFILWSDLATKTLEMMLASAQVIGHRTGCMALAGPFADVKQLVAMNSRPSRNVQWPEHPLIVRCRGPALI